jgi:hypothetical protein
MNTLGKAILIIAIVLSFVGMMAGCADECEQLAETLCDAHSKENCNQWKEVASTMNDESCEESLTALEALD